MPSNDDTAAALEALRAEAEGQGLRWNQDPGSPTAGIIGKGTRPWGLAIWTCEPDSLATASLLLAALDPGAVRVKVNLPGEKDTTWLVAKGNVEPAPKGSELVLVCREKGEEVKTNGT